MQQLRINSLARREALEVFKLPRKHASDEATEPCKTVDDIVYSLARLSLGTACSIKVIVVDTGLT